MEQPEPEITADQAAELADLHAVITQAIQDTPYVIGEPVGPFATVITAGVAAYMGKQVAGVVTELDAGRNTALAEPIRDELSSHLDWSFWGTGMADTFREPLAEAMLAGITPEQRQQANDLITRWRDHREFVGRDLYEAQKAELDAARAEYDRLRQQLAAARNDALTEGAELIAAWSTAQLDEIDEDDLKPSDMERHQHRCEAANVLFAARTAT